MQTPRRPLSPEEARARAVLTVLMRVQHLNDRQVGERAGMTRQAVEARRKEDPEKCTRISLRDIGRLAKALDVPQSLFTMEADEALAWYAENRKELLRSRSRWTVLPLIAA